MTREPIAPAVPEDALDAGGWTVADKRTETLFELATARVRGVTRRYEDERSRAALAAAGHGTGHPVRFFAVTRLGFEPPLPPGIGPAMVAPTVHREARNAFVDRLRERGLRDVDRERAERLRLRDRTRVRLWRYTATDPTLGAGGDLPLECWLGIWARETHFVVTGGHPTVALEAVLPDAPDDDTLARSPDEYREEFLALLRATGEAN